MAKKKSIIITGGSGFVGAYTGVELASKGFRVVLVDAKAPVDRVAWVLREASVEFKQIDVTQRNEIEDLMLRIRPSAVVHAAAIVDPVRLLNQPELAGDVNVQGTINVLSAAHSAGVERFIFVSSVSVLPRPQEDTVAVDHPLFLKNEGPGGGFYAASKIAGEAFCHAATDGLGMSCRIVRPSAVYGFGMSWGMGLKEMVEESVHAGSHLAEKYVHVPRDFTYVRDVASMIALLAQKTRLRQRTFFAASGRELVSLADVATVLRELGLNAAVDWDSPLTNDDVRETSYRAVLDVNAEELKQEWSPEWQLREGIHEYVALEKQYKDAKQKKRQVCTRKRGERAVSVQPWRMVGMTSRRTSGLVQRVPDQR